jgi:hypothetical protein
MGDENILDIAHISFLDMIKVMITLSGVASAKGTLIRNAIKTAEKIPETDYPTFERFLAAIENASNPITMVEGKSSHQGKYVFGLKLCPFGPSIRNYTKVFEKLPDGFADFTAEFNKPSNVTDQYRVGEGARPLRRAPAVRAPSREGHDGGGGSTSPAGLCPPAARRASPKWLMTTGCPSVVMSDNHMCCYCLQIEPMAAP